MEIVIIAALAGSALIHLIPLVGVLGPSRVVRMYDVAVDGPDMSVLLQHRAVLFGLLGAALVGAMFREDARPYVIGAVLVSDIAFLMIAALNPGLNDSMKRVARADVIAIALLLIAGVGVLT